MIHDAADWWYGPNAFPAITNAITISGHGATISRAVDAPKFRFFYISGGFSTVPAGTLVLQDLTLGGGLARGGDGGVGMSGGGGGAGFGGAIYNQGHTDLTNVTLRDNTALGGNGGGTYVYAENNGGGGGLGGNGSPVDGRGHGAGSGGGFRFDGGPVLGGGFTGTEGGGSGDMSGAAPPGTSPFGGNGGYSLFARGGGGGGSYGPGTDGAWSPQTVRTRTEEGEAAADGRHRGVHWIRELERKARLHVRGARDRSGRTGSRPRRVRDNCQGCRRTHRGEYRRYARRRQHSVDPTARHEVSQKGTSTPSAAACGRHRRRCRSSPRDRSGTSRPRCD